MGIAKKFCIGAASLIVAAGAFVTLLSVTGGSADAITMGSRRDCGYTDVIINCGATTQAELLQKYDSNDDGRGNHDIQAIYNHYGIQRSDITGETSEVKKGWLNTNGVISVDGKTVATNAKSLYRVWVDHQVSPVSIAGKTYYIGPVANNYSLGADVYVFFKNGVFHAAIQASCGNPIVATPEKPEPKPEYKCVSLKADRLERDRFRFTAAASAKNGAVVTSYNYDFGDGNKQAGAGATIEHEYAEAGTYTATVSVNVSVNGQSVVSHSPNCKVTITVEEEPKEPVFRCDSLTAKRINRTTYEFTADATARDGAEIVDYTYDFGDGSRSTTEASTVTHEYDDAGNYDIKVTVNFTVNGEAKTATGPNCKVTITVEEEPVEPTYMCENLTARLIGDRTFEYNLTYAADGGAVLDRVTYDFGDNTSETFDKDDAASVEHTYAEAGNYTTTATLYFNVPENGETVEKSKDCEVEVTVSEEPCPIPGKEHLPKDSPECKEDEEMCPVPGKEHLPVDSEECFEPCPYDENLPKDSKECVETPPELPKTGLDMLIGGGIGLGSITAAGYYWSASRRNLLDALLNK